MTLTPLKELTFNTTNLIDDTTPTWDNIAGYSIDTIRQLNNKLYKALDLIDPLCEYIHDNSDPLNPHYTYQAVDDVEVTNTAVRCELNVTVVYNKDTNKYYLFDNSTGTTPDTGNFYFVDFTTQDPSTPVNFTEVFDYRYLKYNPSDTPLKWEDLGYTNKYKCLDNSLSSQTVGDATIDGGNITMSFIVSSINEIHLLNVYGSEVTIVINTTDTIPTEIYNETIELLTTSGADFYEWYFGEYVFTDKFSDDIPVAFEVQVDITITAISGDSRIGLIGLGKSVDLGATLYGASVGILDFSKKIVNTNGETFLEKGNFKATNKLTLDIYDNRTDEVADILTEYRATPVIFRTKGYKSLIVFGTYNKFNILITLPTVSKMNIDLESLI